MRILGHCLCLRRPRRRRRRRLGLAIVAKDKKGGRQKLRVYAKAFLRRDRICTNSHRAKHSAQWANTIQKKEN